MPAWFIPSLKYVQSYAGHLMHVQIIWLNRRSALLQLTFLETKIDRRCRNPPGIAGFSFHAGVLHDSINKSRADKKLQ